MGVELKRSADFHEYAEAVGVPTSQVMAVHGSPGLGAFVVIYTPEPLPADDPDGVDTTAWAAKLRRDRDKILHTLEPGEPTPFSVHEVCAALVRMIDA